METLKSGHPRNLWGRTVYAVFPEEIDPFSDLSYFRPLSRTYTGDISFWETPSPEPNLDRDFWDAVKAQMGSPDVRKAALRLAAAISQWEPDGKKLVFAAILRAGVPVADWLCRLMPGAEAVAVSLFVGLGMDEKALEAIRSDYPDRRILFVDGWTGRGGVSRAVSALGHGPLAVLFDPWGWADFSGSEEDLFCPTACFTGVATLGFSRTFYISRESLFGAYFFPETYCRPNLIRQWRSHCPEPGSLPEAEQTKTSRPFFRETDLRIHANEVCRALINADPRELMFQDEKSEAEKRFPLLLSLAERRKVPAVFGRTSLRDLKTRVACTLNIEKKKS